MFRVKNEKTQEYFAGYDQGVLHWSDNAKDALPLSEKSVDGLFAMIKKGGFRGDFGGLAREWIEGYDTQRGALANCELCNDKNYVVSERDSGLFAVERCDDCGSRNGVLSDEDAAKLARKDGIACVGTYPCYLELSPEIIDKYSQRH